MPDAPHAAASVATRHNLRAVVRQGLDALRIDQKMRRTFGRPARLRIDGHLAADLSVLRVKPPAAMRRDWDYYKSIGMIPIPQSTAPAAH
jgi:hypothetical protein